MSNVDALVVQRQRLPLWSVPAQVRSPIGDYLRAAPGFIPRQVLWWPSSDRASVHEQASSEDRL